MTRSFRKQPIPVLEFPSFPGERGGRRKGKSAEEEGRRGERENIGRYLFGDIYPFFALSFTVRPELMVNDCTPPPSPGAEGASR